jgi:hypothetical protein
VAGTCERGFHKIYENSGAAERLVAFQEGLSSTKLVSALTSELVNNSVFVSCKTLISASQ